MGAGAGTCVEETSIVSVRVVSMLAMCALALAARPAVATVPVPVPAPVDELVLNTTFEGELPADAPDEKGMAPYRLHGFTPPADGTVTISLVSYEFDAVLAVRDADGSVLAQDDNGLMRTHSRVVLACRKDEPLEIIASMVNAGHGRAYSLRVDGGVVAPPTGPWASRIHARTHEGFARTYLHNRDAGRGDPAEAAATALEYFVAAADEFWKASEYAECGDVAAEAGTLAQQVGHPVRELQSRILEALAAAASSDSDQAFADLLALTELSRESPVEGWALQRAVTCARGVGRADVAVDYCASLEALGRRSGDAVLVMSALQSRADVWVHEGRWEDAEAGLSELIEVAREAGHTSVERDAAYQVAQLAVEQGANHKAREVLEALLESPLTPDQQIAARGSLAGALFHLGFLGKAREHYQRALADAVAIGAEHHVTSATVGMALMHHALGEDADAESMLVDLIERKAPLTPAVEVAKWWLLLAAVQNDLHGLERAESSIELALEAARRGGDVVMEGRIHLTRGDFLADDELWEPLEELLATTFAHAERHGLRELEAQAFSNRSSALIQQGRAEQAGEDAERALALFEELDLQTGLWRLAALENLATVRVAEGDLAAGAALIALAEEQFAQHERQDLDAHESSGRRSQYFGWSMVSQDLTARLLAESTASDAPDVIASGWETAGRWKGRALLEGVLAADAGGAPHQQSVAQALAATAAFRARLAPNEVLLEYAAGNDDLYAYVATHDQVRLVALGSRKAIEATSQDYRDVLSRPPGDASAGSPQAQTARILTLGTSLYTSLVRKPLESVDADESVDRLLVVPDVTVTGLPFEALVAEAGADLAATRFVIDTHQVVYGPSVPVFAALAKRPTRSGGRLLALADAVYPTESSELHGRPSGGTRGPFADLPRLPGTRLEALMIAAAVEGASFSSPAVQSQVATFQSKRDSVLETDRLDLRVGASAHPSLLRSQAGEYAVIHLAAHGIIDALDPRRSGVALSGGQDGYLSIADVLGLDLDANVTVLSACETARGQVRKGEGAQSLASAFLYAGSRSVVASLWMVDDVETAMTMRGFYQGYLGDGLSAGESLHAAKRALRGGRLDKVTTLAQGTRRGAPAGAGAGAGGRGVVPLTADHPYYWAPFIYIGRP